MKLSFHSSLPPERLHLSIAGETARDLHLFQQYLHETQQQDQDLKQIVATIVEAFLTSGDRQFLAWKKGRLTKPAVGQEAGQQRRNGEGKAGISGASTEGYHA
jgi:hypothetical protein